MIRPRRETRLSESDIALTVALILFSNQRPLSFDEIQCAMKMAGYSVPSNQTLEALYRGPFLCTGTSWILATAES